MKYHITARACPSRNLSLMFFALLSLGAVFVAATRTSDHDSYDLNANVEESSSNPIVRRKLEKDAFPEHCTWQCYLRQNQDLYYRVNWTEIDALDHWNNHGKKTGRNCACKALFLAGPHKAASTTLQHLSVIYSRLDSQLTPWAWSVGSDSKGFAAFPNCYYPNSGVYRVAYLGNRTGCTHLAMHHNTDQLAEFYNIEEKNVTDDMVDYDIMKIIWKRKFQADYDEGKNLIFGTEATDTLTIPESIESDNEIISTLPMKAKGYEDTTLLDELLSMLPKKLIDHRDEYLNTLVVYRTSRVSHLKSAWRQMNGQNKRFREKITMREFICKDRWIQTSFHWIDVMGLLLALLKKDFKVQLLDLTSLQIDDYEENINPMSILICDVMGDGCTLTKKEDYKMPLAMKLYTRHDDLMERVMIHRNVSPEIPQEEIDLTLEEMDKIDDLINQWDCVRYKEMKPYMNNVELLYDVKFTSYMAKCEETPTIKSRAHLISSMQEFLEC